MNTEFDLIAQAASALLQEHALRWAAGAVGALVLLHFSCMAFKCFGPSVPVVDALLIAAICASATAVVFDAAFLSERELLLAIICMSGALILFMLRLWQSGMHVSRFLKDKHTCS